MPLTVTFDTNALADVVSPETSQHPTNPADAARVRAAVQAGSIRGFFSETLVTIEGIETKDRRAVLSSSRLVSSSSSENKNSITLKLAFQQDRNPPELRFSGRIQTARSLGMRALMVPRLLGSGVSAKDDDGTFFEPIGDLEQFVARAVRLRSEIGARGIGHAVAMKLGLDGLSQRQVDGGEAQEGERPSVEAFPILGEPPAAAKPGEGAFDDPAPGLWYEGLRHASRNKVKEAVAEWADGDSLVAHYGYGIDLFCSRDWGKNAGKNVLHPDNRQWLSEEYGIQFVTLAELAKSVTT